MEKWNYLSECPGCQEKNNIERVGSIPNNFYLFGEVKIDFPSRAIDLMKCNNCHLFYKNIIPSPSFLSQVINEQHKNVWDDNYSYKYEYLIIKDLLQDERSRLLDIGCGKGAFISKFIGLSSCLSGLDLIPMPKVFMNSEGEYIKDFIDNDINAKYEYDVITAFDIFEHLYSPTKAFKNVAQLLKKGGVINIETGDIDTRKKGIQDWWYVNLFEHHVFWSRDSFEFYANKYNLKVVGCNTVKHKLWRERGGVIKFKHCLKMMVWNLFPKLYKKISLLTGANPYIEPQSPIIKDHINLLLKKE